MFAGIGSRGNRSGEGHEYINQFSSGSCEWWDHSSGSDRNASGGLPGHLIASEFQPAWSFKRRWSLSTTTMAQCGSDTNISMNEHTGTHFDAPIHWVSGKDLPNNTVDAIPAKDFIAPACVVDCSKEVAEDQDYLHQRAFDCMEEEHGQIPAGSWVFLRSDWRKIASLTTTRISKRRRSPPARQ